MKKLLLKSPPQRILIITLRYLGDTLLVTPLINAIKQAYPHAQLDVLAFDNTAAILQGNPAITHILTVARKPTWQDNLQLFKRIFRQYDLAVSTQTGDRPTLYACLASNTRIGFVPQHGHTGWFKRYFLNAWLEFDVQNTHTVLEILRLCELLQIAPVYQLTPPQELSGFKKPEGLQPNYAVLHIMPQWKYKQWTAQGWMAVANYLAEQDVQVVLSGSAQAEEVAYLNEIAAKMPMGTLNLAGQLSLGQLAEVIANARLFIGVDTGISHLAAATGVPIIALFGPSDPVKWTPWPSGYNSKQPPFVSKGNQQVNNITLLQGSQECVPCYLEGCERHRNSYSACLDSIPPEQVIAVISQLLQST